MILDHPNVYRIIGVVFSKFMQDFYTEGPFYIKQDKKNSSFQTVRINLLWGFTFLPSYSSDTDEANLVRAY